MSARAGWIVPSALALATREGDRFSCVDLRDGGRIESDGVLADVLARWLDEGTRGPLFELLPAESRARLEELAARPRRKLDGASALALDGFGTLFLELLGRCNERCVHCYADSGPSVASALDEPTWRAVLDDAASLGFRAVQLTGGDPLLFDALDDVVAHARAVGIGRVEIATNGIACDERRLDALAPYAPAFAISIYSHDPATHDAVTRTPGSHARTVRAFQRIVARGLAVRASIIATRENAGDVAATVDLVSALGVARWGVSAVHAVGRGVGHDAPTIGDFPRARHDAGEDDAVVGKLCVASDGRVHPCPFHRDRVLGDVRARRLADIARRPSRRLRVVTESTPIERRLECFGCRLTAVALDACAGEEVG